MSDQEKVGTVDERVARLEQQVQELLEVVAAQRAAIEASEVGHGDRRSATVPLVRPGAVPSATMPGQAPMSDPTPDPASVSDPTARSLNRRRLLFGGAAAAAAATAAVATSASPAAAANGGNLILGQNNTATAETKLTYGGSANNGFRVEGGSSLAMIEGYQTGSAPGVKGAHSGGGDGVVGFSATGTGVYGEAASRGVFGRGTGTGQGVRGESDGAGIGVEGLSFGGGYGVAGQSDGVGVSGLSTGAGDGVNGQSDGTGVRGFGSNSGVGVVAYADGVGSGLVAESVGGVGAVARGARANLHLPLRSGRAAPSSDSTAHSMGEVVVDGSGAVWLCIADGTPGTWRKIGGPATAGALHVLPAPARIVDTRPGGVPTSVLPKTPLAAGSTRVYDLKVNSSGVPAGATAALITVLLVNAANGNGNMTLWANGVAKPTANTMVWGAGAGRWTATAVSALDSQARVQVNVSAQTDLVLDVVGFYR